VQFNNVLFSILVQQFQNLLYKPDLNFWSWYANSCGFSYCWFTL